MRVAYVIPYLQRPSGWRSHSRAFLRAMRPYVEPVLFVSAKDFGIAKSLFPSDSIYSLPVTQQASMSSWRCLRDLVANRRAVGQGHFPEVDLVHSLEAYPTGLVGMWLSHKMHCPHVLTTHGTYGIVWYEKPLDRFLYQQVLKDASRIYPVSHGTASMLRQYFGQVLPVDRIHPILNGNDFFREVPQSKAFNRVLPAIPTLLSVGDVKHRKGYHISLAAYERVKSQIPNARYWIVGSYDHNDYYRQLKTYITTHQLQDVEFIGSVSEEELRRRYKGASVFILTPQQEGLKFEGFGLVYLEAGAYGLPVVATRTGGVPDAVKDGETGYLCNPNDVDSIAASLINLLSDPKLACEMGRANRVWAEMLTWERNAKEQSQAYQDVLRVA